ncbi:MAG: DMT family protein [Candidatus Omnitrophica bacterium]|nr:DMT family protein [Candidatus Omnitrophota bacterium]
MPKILITVFMLACSNIFMTFAWYGHLKNFQSRPWVVAALISWAIALFEYLIQVPANRIGYQVMNLGQLKILQETITLSVFIPFSILYMKQGIRQEYVWASIFILAAVFCVFKGALAK